MASLELSSINQHPVLADFLKTDEPKEVNRLALQLKTLYTLKIDDSDADMTPLTICSFLGKIPQLTVLLQLFEKQEAADAETSSIRTATKNLKMVFRLLSGDDPYELMDNIKNQLSPLRWAAENGHLDALKLLVSHPSFGRNIAANNNLVLQKAMVNKHQEIIDFLLNDPNVLSTLFSDKALYIMSLAAEHGDIDFINTLLKYPEILKILNEGTLYPLYNAIQFGYINITNLLTSLPQVKKNMQGKEGDMLVVAAQHGRHPLIKWLVEVFPIFEKVIAYNTNQPFRLAAEHGHEGTVRFLLKYPEVEALMSAKNNDALKKAAYYKHTNIVNLLLSNPNVLSLAEKDSAPSVQKYVTLFEESGKIKPHSLTPIDEKCSTSDNAVPQSLGKPG